MRKLDKKKGKPTKRYGEPQEGRILRQVTRDIYSDQYDIIEKMGKEEDDRAMSDVMRELIDIGLKHYNDED
jgi:hypothetical protein